MIRRHTSPPPLIAKGLRLVGGGEVAIHSKVSGCQSFLGDDENERFGGCESWRWHMGARMSAPFITYNTWFEKEPERRLELSFSVRCRSHGLTLVKYWGEDC